MCVCVFVELSAGCKGARLLSKEQLIHSRVAVVVCRGLLLAPAFVPLIAAGGEFVWLLTFPGS